MPNNDEPRSKKTVFVLILALSLLLLAEIGSRTIWVLLYDVPFFQPETIPLHRYYPQLYSNVSQEPIKKGDGFFDILLLGGSVLAQGKIKKLLLEKCASRTGKRVRVHNLAFCAHTSWDSLYKYQHLSDKNFDLILVYHGINDARTNNCPPEFFKSDYSHYSWYSEIKLFERHKEIGILTLPCSLDYLRYSLEKQLGLTRYLPRHNPIRKWTEYGKDVKTYLPFKHNLTQIVRIAQQKKENLILMSFASYLPKGYTYRKFIRKAIDYGFKGNPSCPAELWGKPKFVAKAISKHNTAIKETVTHFNFVRFVDQKKLIPRSGLYFKDICHLTPRGCRKFVDNLLPVIVKLAGNRDLRAKR
ncbi:MAG: hypothetical protein ACE5GM_00170 [bacterium]